MTRRPRLGHLASSKRGAATLFVALTAASAASAQQISPDFRCRPVVVDGGDLGRALDYQRIGEPQTATTIDVLFLYSPNHSGASRELAKRHVAGATDLFAGQRPPDPDDPSWPRGSPPPEAKTGITLRLVGYERVPRSMEGDVRRVEQARNAKEASFEEGVLLDRIRRNDDVETERKRVGADIVVVWTDSSDGRSGGRAFQPSSGFSRDLAFIVLAGAADGSGIGAVVLAHEVGHILGLAHNPGDQDWYPPYVSHGQGYAIDDIWGTVMAVRLNVPTFSFDGEYVIGGWQGRVGDANHRAAEAAAVGAQFVADYEQAQTPAPDPEPDPTPEPEPDPKPGGDEAPCDATGEGINLDGHQLFMCIVANGEVEQLAAHRLSSRSMLFGRLADPKAVVKLVRSCQWGAVAAVVTARKFQIRVHNSANGKEWLYNHNTNTLAPSAYSGDALCD